MRDTLRLRRSGIHVFALLIAIVFLAAPPAGAQGFLSPFWGYNFGGDAGCPQITNCNDRHTNFGLSAGALGSIVGFEAEFAYTSDFLGVVSSGSETNVMTLMGNFMLAPKIGPIQPYGLGGIGLIRTMVQTAGADEDANQIGWDVGGGLMAFFSAHFGLRGDVRYFHSFEILDGSRFPNLPIRETKLDFGRFSIAAVFKF